MSHSHRIPQIGEVWSRKNNYVDETVTILAYDEETKTFFVRCVSLYTGDSSAETFTDSYPLDSFDLYNPPVDRSKDFTTFVNAYGETACTEAYVGEVHTDYEKISKVLKNSPYEIQERWIGTLEFGIRDGERYVKFVEESGS